MNPFRRHGPSCNKTGTFLKEAKTATWDSNESLAR